MAAHAKLSPSAAYRWLNCPGSVALCATLPKGRPSSFWADEGTAAHAVAEKCFAEKQDSAEYLRGWYVKLSDNYGGAMFLSPTTSKTLEGFEVNSDMIEAVQVYLDAVREPGLPVIPEQRLSLEHIWPGMFGTCDAQVHDKTNGILYVWDYKHGAGVLVEPDHNPQAMLYAVGALHALKDASWVKTVQIGIVQPRHRDGGVLTWETTPGELEEWVKGQVKPATLATKKKGAPLVPGDKQCRWCDAKAICPALMSKALATAQVAFADVEVGKPTPVNLPDMRSLTPESRGLMADILIALDDYKTAFFAYLQELAEQGEATPGWKLVRGRANRKWRSEDEVARRLGPTLGDALWERKLKSPSKVEKIKGVDKNVLSALWEKPEGKLAIAPESDPRPAAEVRPMLLDYDDPDDFSDL